MSCSAAFLLVLRKERSWRLPGTPQKQAYRKAFRYSPCVDLLLDILQAGRKGRDAVLVSIILLNMGLVSPL